MKLSSPTLTIVSVTGHSDYTQGSVYAIERSYQELQKKLPQESLKCLLVSPNRPDYLPDYILHLTCAPFSYIEYNLFILYSLDQLIETEFALIVQNDGFVINGDNWKEEFFEYDYIGAPIFDIYRKNSIGNWMNDLTMEERKIFLKNSKFYHNKEWIIPQNGGFSLRSKKILGMPRKLNLPLQIFAPKYFNQQPLAIRFPISIHNEDLFLTLLYRYALMEQGIRFAPLDLACLFSYETTLIHYILDINPNKVLGCHTFGHLILLNTYTLYMNKKIPFYNNDLSTNHLTLWLMNAGFNITVPKKYLELPI